MTTRQALRRHLASAAGFSRYTPSTCSKLAVSQRLYSSTTSSLPESTRQTIKNESLLPNPDPAPESPSASLIDEVAPYMVATYARPPPVFVRGEGSYLWDVENRKYLDFTGGIAVNALGHCDPGVTQIVADQAKTLVHASNLYYNPWIGKLSKILVEKTIESGGMHNASSVFVCNSGSEANEAAIKFARKVGKAIDPSGAKHQFVSFAGAFHGRTMGSLSATPNPKYQQPFSPMIPGFEVGTYNDMASIDKLVIDKTCGVIVEPIQGEGGVQPATDEFLIALAKRCREVGAVLIYDEIQCGLSRTGNFWAHGCLPKEAHPDILTSAKALGNGFPVGAVIVNKEVADKIKVGDHGTTYGGNPLASRVAHYMVQRLSDVEMQKSVKSKSKVLVEQLKDIKERFPELFKEIRGKGLMLGLQMTEDPTPVIKAARERGLLIITAGTNVVRFVPSLTVTEDEIKKGCAILVEAIEAVRSA